MFCSKCGTELNEQGVCPKCGCKKGKIKTGVIIGCAIAGVAVVGIGVGVSVGEPTGVRLTEGSKYQYQVISPDDVIVEYSGLKPDKPLSRYGGTYVTDTSVYLTDEVGVYLDGEHFTTMADEFVAYTDIIWSWDESQNGDFYRAISDGRDGRLDESLFSGAISYADGTISTVEADEVWCGKDDEIDMHVSILFSDEEYKYLIPISETWDIEGDESSIEAGGESTLESEGDSEGTTTGNSEAVAVKENYLFSSSDCPELDIDWDLFNEVAAEKTEGYISDLFPKDVFSIMEGDPRVDWSIVNDMWYEWYLYNGELTDYQAMSMFVDDLFVTFEGRDDYAIENGYLSDIVFPHNEEIPRPSDYVAKTEYEVGYEEGVACTYTVEDVRSYFEPIYNINLSDYLAVHTTYTSYEFQSFAQSATIAASLYNMVVEKGITPDSKTAGFLQGLYDSGNVDAYNEYKYWYGMFASEDFEKRLLEIVEYMNSIDTETVDDSTQSSQAAE